MALNFTVSYTFSPNTTIASSQVNTNTNDVANVFTGLEALTKSFAKLKVDADPGTSLEVATKQYVDHYAGYRRPVLKWGGVTTISVESGLDGTSGDIPIVFPDGQLRTETSTTRTTFDITRNAVLTTSGAQSGLAGVTSEGANTWYALYACKITDSTTGWVTVGSTVLPLQANFSTLNTAYGTNGWVYLGLVRNGDGGSTTGDLLNFYMSGNATIIKAQSTGGNYSGSKCGLLLATSAGTTSLTYAYSAGTSGAVIPNNITLGYWSFAREASASELVCLTQREVFRVTPSSGRNMILAWSGVADGANITNGSSTACDIILLGWMDGILGVGSNPLL